MGIKLLAHSVYIVSYGYRVIQLKRCVGETAVL